MAGHPNDCDAAIERLEQHVNSRHVSRTDWVGLVRSDLADLRSSLPPPPGDSRIEQLTADAPRLAPAVARLDVDYRRITRDIDGVTDGLPYAAGSAVAAIVDDLVDDVARYRDGVADLIHEAYEVDIGGED